MHNNIKPCWWGHSVWMTIYCITAAYPENPSKEHIESMRNYFKSLKYLLPCEGCQESYGKFSCESCTNADDLENFRTRDNLIMFVFKLRTKVNGKLTHEYLITPSYFKKKLNYMIINENNNFDGKVCDMVEAPFVPEELEKKSFTYLRIKTNYDCQYSKKIIDSCKKFMKDPVFDYNNKEFKLVYGRNKKCRKLIRKIYHRMSEGDYDLVQSFIKYDKTLHESLLFLGCSILHKENLKQIFDLALKN